ncbi:AraC family transcriptional regulator [Pseudoteredinibacter isoporae]|uniref:AraC-like DNA-binding protein n=1 Tax=Pseudoteredinibacter isoporae TaxID=570281 RepID=A0A7X0JP73_9GAMM|nr:AraC family transcriptional regulator [Pseudoteredinibacter isoporae]MBB6519759.1 AraC-like DNA-binding protein [Pseudoteredinibacter isoporae]NHO85340.1 AraC family transcriptional regulator [Pseudoteredinibacter isoporae]NIB26208.1 AraC family transcriptional regulator [Pseudoteredinibacter isoporae]
MAITSDWPLPPQATRFLTPHVLFEWLMVNPLTKGLYPVAMGYYPSALGHYMERQEHDNQLLLYCTAGSGYLQLGDQASERIQRGQLIALPKGQPHKYWADQQTPWSIYWLHFEGELAEQLMGLLSPTGKGSIHKIGTKPQVLAGFEALFDVRYTATSRTGFIHGCHQTQQLISLLAVLARQSRLESKQAINMEKVEAFMQQHLHSNFSLDELAQHMRRSKFHFSKVFKELTGQSPMQYFIAIKMQHACSLLDSSGQSVKRISASLGYDDAYYFSRLFKKQIGLSPSDYRRSRHQ